MTPDLCYTYLVCKTSTINVRSTTVIDDLLIWTYENVLTRVPPGVIENIIEVGIYNVYLQYGRCWFSGASQQISYNNCITFVSEQKLLSNRYYTTHHELHDKMCNRLYRTPCIKYILLVIKNIININFRLNAKPGKYCSFTVPIFHYTGFAPISTIKLFILFLLWFCSFTLQIYKTGEYLHTFGFLKSEAKSQSVQCTFNWYMYYINRKIARIVYRTCACRRKS